MEERNRINDKKLRLTGRSVAATSQGWTSSREEYAWQSWKANHLASLINLTQKGYPMDESAKKAARQARIEMTRKFNSLIVNMTKTQTIIYDLARAIELDEKHQKEDREQAIAFIDQQIDIIRRSKESFLQSETKPDIKSKKDA